MGSWSTLESVSPKLKFISCSTSFGASERSKSPFRMSHVNWPFAMGLFVSGSTNWSLLSCLDLEYVWLSTMPKLYGQVFVMVIFSWPTFSTPNMRTTAVRLDIILQDSLLSNPCKEWRLPRYLVAATEFSWVSWRTQAPPVNTGTRRSYPPRMLRNSNLCLILASKKLFTFTRRFLL